MYEKILKDDKIIELYKNIDDYEDKNKGWAHHNLTHAINVATMIESILKQLEYNNEFIDEAKVAALLHDIGCIKGKDHHAERSAIMAKKYLNNNQIKLKYEDEVIEAIKYHSAGFEEKNIMTLCLIFCDKLDIKKSRVGKEGYNIIGMRQFQYINNIKIKINDKNVKVDFIIGDGVDLKELENFYFINKVFNAINSFSNIIKRKALIKINNKIWKKQSE